MRQDPHRLVGGAAGELAHVVDEVVRLLIDAAEVGVGAGLAVLRADRALPPVEGLGALAAEQVGELVANLALAGAGAQVVGSVERALEHHAALFGSLGAPRHDRLARHPQRALDALAAHLALQRALDKVGDLRLVDLAADAHLQQEAVDRGQQVTPHRALAPGGRLAQLGQDFVHEAIALGGGLQILGVALELGVVVDHTRPSGGDLVVALGGEFGQAVAQRLPAALAQHAAQAVVLADLVQRRGDRLGCRSDARRVEVCAALVRLVPGGQAARVARADVEDAFALERGHALLTEAIDQRGAELRGRQAGDGVGDVAAG